MGTKIEWAEETWNCVTGCTKVSPGCAFCYITRTPPFRIEGRRFVNGATGVRLHPDRLDIPLRWKKPRLIFVNSLSDLFHEDVPWHFVDEMFAVMAMAPQHTFQILTKRPASMLSYMDESRLPKIAVAAQRIKWRGVHKEAEFPLVWPLPNVWLGVSVENQRMADERIPLLLETPAAVRFLSVEPLLGPVDLTMLNLGRRDGQLGEFEQYLDVMGGTHTDGMGFEKKLADKHRLHWVIVGGESGGPEHRRLVEHVSECVSYDVMDGSRYAKVWRRKPAALTWVCSLRDQCVAADVPLFFKQWGGPKPTSGGRELDGRTWDEMPQRQAAE